MLGWSCLTFDQKVQVWNTVGTWIAAIGTTAAVIASLWLARRGDRLDLHVGCTIEVAIYGGGAPTRRFIAIRVVNRGNRAVRITAVGWKVGKGKKARFAVQTFSDAYSDNCPKTLEHGEEARFFLPIDRESTIAQSLATGFVRDLSERYLSTLRAAVSTSILETVEARPADAVLQLLKEAGQSPA